MDENGDRYCDFSLSDLDPVKDEFVDVAFYSDYSRQLNITGPFHWAGLGRPPPDWPICGWDMSLCADGMVWVSNPLLILLLSEPPLWTYYVISSLLVVLIMSIVSFVVLR